MLSSSPFEELKAGFIYRNIGSCMRLTSLSLPFSPLSLLIIMDLSKRSFNSSPVSDRQEEQSFLLFPQAKATVESFSFVTNQPKAKSACLLNATNPFKLKWDLFLALLTIWNCFYVPYEVVFIDYSADFGLQSIEIVTEIAYMVDILLRIRTSYVDQTTGEEITDSIPILIHYIWSKNLGIDLLSAFPCELITLLSGEKGGFRFIHLLKILKLLRIGSIFTSLRVPVHMRLTLRLAQLLFVFMAYLHLIACLWFLLINTSQQYVPPALYIDHHPDLYEHKESLRQYAYSLYMSVYMLTAAEIGPRTGAERIFVGFALLLGQLFQGYMFGEVAVVLINLNKRTAEIAEVREATTTTMGNMQLTSNLQGKLAEFMQYSLGLSLKQAEFERFFKLLSPSLQKEVGMLTFERVIKLNPAIAGNNIFETSILLRLTTRYCQPEEAIITQGDEATDLYFVAAGKCDVFLLDDKKQVKKMKSLSVGWHFGEIALLYPTLRTASVLAAGYVTLAVMSKQDFADLRVKYPALETAFRQTAMHYRDSWKKYVKNTLRRCPFFAKVRSSVLSQLVYRLPTTRLSPYTYILKEGTSCHQVTFIIEGNVQISLPLSDQKLMAHYMQRQTSIAASLNSQNSIKTQLVKNSRFEVRLEAEDLGNGSVLCPNVVLLDNEKVSFAAQTTETTVVMTLTRDLLATLCQDFPEINNGVERTREELQNDHYFAKLRKLRLLGFDCIKGLLLPISQKSIDLLNAKIKVKRCVIGKVLEKRLFRGNGFQSVSCLSHKLRGILQAQEAGDYDMIEKIYLAYIPAVVDYIFPALHLLSLPEANSPLLTQIAMEAVRVDQLHREMEKQLHEVREAIAWRRKDRGEIAVKLRELQRFTSIVLRMQQKQG